tara:strand:- start:206 stop:775 length:570 start_codon:yes stop_codon:yes gene_type:complete
MSSEIRTDLIKDKSNTKTLATLSASSATLHSDVIFPSGHILKVSTVFLASDIDYSTDTTYQNIFNTADHVCDGGSSNNTTIYPFLDLNCFWINNTTSDARKNIRITYSGVAHSPTVSAKAFTVGAVLAYTASADRELADLITMPLPVVTISASGTLSIKVEIQNVHTSGRFVVMGDNSTESRVRFMEVQ